jgi:hypothetical protein
MQYNIVVEQDTKRHRVHVLRYSVTLQVSRLKYEKKIPFRLTVVDTPGFGDTGGIAQDKQTREYVHSWLQTQAETGLGQLDAICLVIKANENRLNLQFTLEIDQVMALFDRNFEFNIFPFFTFSDGTDPLALIALKDAGIKHGQHFSFNNSALFGASEHLHIFWTETFAAYNRFFLEQLPGVNYRNVRQSITLIEARRRLEHIIIDRQAKIRLEIQHINDISREFEWLISLEKSVAQNKSVLYYTTYKDVIVKQVICRYRKSLLNYVFHIIFKKCFGIYILHTGWFKVNLATLSNFLL